MKKVLLSSVAVLGLAACSTAAPQMAADKAMFEYKQKQVKETTSSIPSWFLENHEDKDVVFSVGTATMPDLQLSIDIARLNAKEQLADRIYSKLRSQTKTYTAKIGGDDFDVAVLNEVEKATKNIVSDAEVNGYEQRKIEVIPNGIQYSSYVLLAFDSKEAAKIIRNRLMTVRAMQSKFQSEKAWKELDKVSKEVKDEEKTSLRAAAGLPESTSKSD